MNAGKRRLGQVTWVAAGLCACVLVYLNVKPSEYVTFRSSEARMLEYYRIPSRSFWEETFSASSPDGLECGERRFGWPLTCRSVSARFSNLDAFLEFLGRSEYAPASEANGWRWGAFAGDVAIGLSIVLFLGALCELIFVRNPAAHGAVSPPPKAGQ